MPKRLIWQLFLGFVLVILIAMLGVSIATSRFFHDTYIAQIERNLRNQAALCAEVLKTRSPSSDAEQLDPEILVISRQLDVSIAVLFADGRILVSDDRALNRGGDMISGSVPVTVGGRETAVVMVSVPIQTIEASLKSLYGRMALIAVAILFGAALIGLILSRRVTSVIRDIQSGAARYASGDLDYRLRVHGILELEQLAASMNEMAAQLDDRMRMVEKQRMELETILASMVEAVIVVDNEERVIKTNAAARKLFRLSEPSSASPSIQTVIRNPDLHRFIRKVLAYSIPIDAEITFHNGDDRVLRIHGTALMGSRGEQIGALIVMNDVSNLKKLETIRQEFVANVSHELKTPITSIIGFIETLRGGAMDDPENAGKFLDIVSRQSERLGRIIDDLLSLSRIEMDAGAGLIASERIPVRKVISQAIAACQESAAAKQIPIETEIPEDLVIRVNPPLFEQALINLIDNAVKYSDAGKPIRIVAREQDRQAEILVIDHGVGIGRDHLPRIFERFYRVDKARSRKLGGTGLGLAIVKHIVLTHGGTVDVTSVPGEGSTFRILLPPDLPAVSA